MGRTVYGVDLEESPFGGLIEKLLTEEELEKLADGGTPAQPGGRPTAPDGGDDGDDESGGAAESDSDAEDEDDWTVSDDTYASKGDADGSADDASADDTGSGASDAESWSPSSPPPSTDPGDGRDFGSGSGYRGSADFDAGVGPAASDDGGSFLSKHKWLLLKVAVGLAALAAVALVIWRFKDRLAGLVPGRGGDDGDELDVDAPGADGDDGDEDVSPARRRAKVDESALDAADDGASEGGDAAGERPRQPPGRDPVEGVETPGQDLDLGALVGLGMLTFVAALVRKYDEERTRPHDPLVDGPLEDDIADDDQ